MSDRTRVTQSMMTALISCEEKMRLRYLERFKTPTTTALGMGSAVHLGFELGEAGAAVQLLEQEAGAIWSESEREKLALDSAIVRSMVEGGLQLWKGWPSRHEVEFRVPFRNPETGRPSLRHDFAGKIDGVFLPGELDGNEVPVLMEIKTTSRLDSTYLERLDLDWQVSAYLAAASDLFGVPVRKMLYRVIRKPSIRPKKKVKLADGSTGPESIAAYAERLADDYATRPEFYFEEVLLVRTDDQIERWMHEAWEAHLRILRIENGGMTIRNARHCLDYGRCPFFDLCRGVVGPSAFSVREDIHPELEGTNP